MADTEDPTEMEEEEGAESAAPAAPETTDAGVKMEL